MTPGGVLPGPRIGSETLAQARRMKRRRRMRGLAAAAAALLLVLSGIWLLDEEEKRPEEHFATMPDRFDGFRRIRAHEATSVGAEFPYVTSRGGGYLTYVPARGDRAYRLVIHLRLDPGVEAPDLDAAAEALLDSALTSEGSRYYAVRAGDGRLRCAEEAGSGTRKPETHCVWLDDAVLVSAETYAERGPGPTPRRTATAVRAFLAALRVRDVP
ncbi:hypothetical protein ABZ626_34625 [Streptomyces longispororuber]|uniref:hypothetical protein n=1 Tax=Streptomyces longispororuber TaxID=68230 RepID=UPI0033D47FAB